MQMRNKIDWRIWTVGIGVAVLLVALATYWGGGFDGVSNLPPADALTDQN